MEIGSVQSERRRELCRRLMAAAGAGQGTPLGIGQGASQVVYEGDDAYVVKQLPGSVVAEVKGRLSAWKHRVIDGDAACPPGSRRQRVERFHEAVRVWTEHGFGRNVPTLVSGPEDDCIIYCYVQGSLLREAIGSERGRKPGDMRPIVSVLTHCQERHRKALGMADDNGCSLLHQDPHPLNIVISGDLPVFVDLDDPLSRSMAVRKLIGREVGILAYRVLRLLPREQIPRALDEMMGCYASAETWRLAAEFLGQRRRIELLGFARRRRRHISRLALSEAIEARLS